MARGKHTGLEENLKCPASASMGFLPQLPSRCCCPLAVRSPNRLRRWARRAWRPQTLQRLLRLHQASPATPMPPSHGVRRPQLLRPPPPRRPNRLSGLLRTDQRAPLRLHLGRQAQTRQSLSKPRPRRRPHRPRRVRPLPTRLQRYHPRQPPALPLPPNLPRQLRLQRRRRLPLRQRQPLPPQWRRPRPPPRSQRPILPLSTSK